MKLVDLSGVCKARDHQNLGAVFGLLQVVAAFFVAAAPLPLMTASTKEARWSTGNDETLHQRSPPLVLCNRRIHILKCIHIFEEFTKLV